MVELEELGQTWNEAQAKSQDRVEWRRLVSALCPILDQKSFSEWMIISEGGYLNTDILSSYTSQYKVQIN